MKKTLTLTAAAIFALSFGIAYAGTEVSSVRAYDTFEIQMPSHVRVAENSAAGGLRDMNVVQGPAISSVQTYDDFKIDILAAPKGRTVEGSAAGSLRHNFANRKPGVLALDLFEIGR
jgi:hypothetical protein